MDPLLSAGYLGNVHIITVDYPDDLELTTKAADVNGNATVTTDTVAQGFIWRVERMTTFVSDNQGNLISNPPAGALLSVYKLDGGSTAVKAIKFRDGSQSPGLDVADEQSPITVQQSLCLCFAFTGLTPGTFGNVTVQYQLVRKLVGIVG